MRRPRRRLIYAAGLQDPDVPSYVRPNSFVKCNDDFKSRKTRSELPSSTDSNPRDDLCRQSSILRRIRLEMQQLEHEANHTRILEDLESSRTVLEEIVDEVVATFPSHTQLDDASSGRRRTAQGECCHLLKELTCEPKFSTLHLNVANSSKGADSASIHETDTIPSEKVVQGRCLERMVSSTGVLDGEVLCAEASSSEKPGVELEESLWGTLPSDLVERILARLPLPCLVRCRAVCRKWNQTVLEDRGFHSRILRQKPWLFTWDSWIEDDSHAYNPSLDRWYQLPLSFIPHEHVKRPLHIVGAVDGLLVFEYFARLYIALCICNPVNRTWRKFPPLNEKRVQPVVAVFEDPDSSVQRGDFTVVVAGGLSKPSVMHKVYSTEIFQSRTNCWRKTCDKITEDGGHIRWGPYVRTAFCNGNLYYMLWKFKLLAYNLKRETWSIVKAPSPPALDPQSGISPFLVESRGRLLMIGFLDNENRVAQDGLAIWELNTAGTLWVEIARMPEQFFSQMPLRKIQGVGCADLIYIFENFSTPVVICDLSKHTPRWRQIDSGCIRGNNRVIYGCATDLRLDALV